jgi:Uma2 family endonuclease
MAAEPAMSVLLTRHRFTVDEYHEMARAGVREVWLVDLVGARTEVHRDPAVGGYRTPATRERGEVRTPAAFPDVSVPVTLLRG